MCGVKLLWYVILNFNPHISECPVTGHLAETFAWGNTTITPGSSAAQGSKGMGVLHDDGEYGLSHYDNFAKQWIEIGRNQEAMDYINSKQVRSISGLASSFLPCIVLLQYILLKPCCVALLCTPSHILRRVHSISHLQGLEIISTCVLPTTHNIASTRLLGWESQRAEQQKRQPYPTTSSRGKSITHNSSAIPLMVLLAVSYLQMLPFHVMARLRTTFCLKPTKSIGPPVTNLFSAARHACTLTRSGADGSSFLEPASMFTQMGHKLLQRNCRLTLRTGMA